MMMGSSGSVKKCDAGSKSVKYGDKSSYKNFLGCQWAESNNAVRAAVEFEQALELNEQNNSPTTIGPSEEEEGVEIEEDVGKSTELLSSTSEDLFAISKGEELPVEHSRSGIELHRTFYEIFIRYCYLMKVFPWICIFAVSCFGRRGKPLVSSSKCLLVLLVLSQISSVNLEPDSLRAKNTTNGICKPDEEPEPVQQQQCFAPPPEEEEDFCVAGALVQIARPSVRIPSLLPVFVFHSTTEKHLMSVEVASTHTKPLPMANMNSALVILTAVLFLCSTPCGLILLLCFLPLLNCARRCFGHSAGHFRVLCNHLQPLAPIFILVFHSFSPLVNTALRCIAGCIEIFREHRLLLKPIQFVLNCGYYIIYLAWREVKLSYDCIYSPLLHAVFQVCLKAGRFFLAVSAWIYSFVSRTWIMAVPEIVYFTFVFTHGKDVASIFITALTWIAGFLVLSIIATHFFLTEIMNDTTAKENLHGVALLPNTTPRENLREDALLPANTTVRGDPYEDAPLLRTQQPEGFDMNLFSFLPTPYLERISMKMLPLVLTPQERICVKLLSFQLTLQPGRLYMQILLYLPTSQPGRIYVKMLHFTPTPQPYMKILLTLWPENICMKMLPFLLTSESMLPQPEGLPFPPTPRPWRICAKMVLSLLALLQEKICTKMLLPASTVARENLCENVPLLAEIMPRENLCEDTPSPAKTSSRTVEGMPTYDTQNIGRNTPIKSALSNSPTVIKDGIQCASHPDGEAVYIPGDEMPPQTSYELPNSFLAYSTPSTGDTRLRERCYQPIAMHDFDRSGKFIQPSIDLRTHCHTLSSIIGEDVPPTASIIFSKNSQPISIDIWQPSAVFCSREQSYPSISTLIETPHIEDQSATMYTCCSSPCFDILKSLFDRQRLLQRGSHDDIQAPE